MAPRHSAIIFDLDGTLVDTARDLTEALNVVLAQSGCRPVAPERVRNRIGGGARRLVALGFAETGMALDAGELDRRTADFLAHYRAHLTDLSRPFPAVSETLRVLAAAGAIMGVCTNKPAEPSRQILADLELNSFFGTVLGGDSLAVRKPDPEHLGATIRALGALPAHAVMVGDSEIDVAAARNLGVPAIAVAYGYAPIPAVELGADAVIERFADLPEAIAKLP
jgi:phosphoglycolate phosphatase